MKMWRSSQGVSTFSCKQKMKYEKHGMSTTRFNSIYRKIKQRCITGSCPEYKYYGGRGIGVEWKTFADFKGDMYGSYSEHVKKYGEDQTQIDRIDNNKNYCKKNCRWATRKEQMNNTRYNVVINLNGEKKNLSEWSEKTGIKYTTIRQRIFVYGWDIKRALTIK